MSGDLSCTRDQVNGPSLWTKSTKQVSGPSQRTKSVDQVNGRSRSSAAATTATVQPGPLHRRRFADVDRCRCWKTAVGRSPTQAVSAVRMPTRKESQQKPATRLMKKQLPRSFNRSQLLSGTTTATSVKPQAAQPTRSHHDSVHVRCL